MINHPIFIEIKNAFPLDLKLAEMLTKNNVAIFGDVRSQKRNDGKWMKQINSVRVDDQEMRIGIGTRFRHRSVTSRTAILTDKYWWRDEQYPQIVFTSVSAWAQFAMRTDPLKADNPPSPGIEVDGWKNTEICPNNSDSWYPAMNFYSPNTNIRSQNKNPIKAATANNSSTDMLSILDDDIVDTAIEQPIVSLVKRPSHFEEESLPKKRKQKLKSHMREEFLEHMERTQLSKYQKCTDDDLKRFFTRWYSLRCPFCGQELPSYQKTSLDGKGIEKTVQGQRCHLISRNHGAPKSQYLEQVGFACASCNGNKVDYGMGDDNLFAFTATKYGCDLFITLSKQFYLLHIGDFQTKQLGGWSSTMLNECHQYIQNRFVQFKHGWNAKQRELGIQFNNQIRFEALSKHQVECFQIERELFVRFRELEMDKLKIVEEEKLLEEKKIQNQLELKNVTDQLYNL